MKKAPIPLAEILNSDSNQNNIGLLPKQVFSNQILTGSVTDSLQLERQRAVLHSQPVRPVYLCGLSITSSRFTVFRHLAVTEGQLSLVDKLPRELKFEVLDPLIWKD